MGHFLVGSYHEPTDVETRIGPRLAAAIQLSQSAYLEAVQSTTDLADFLHYVRDMRPISAMTPPLGEARGRRIDELLRPHLTAGARDWRDAAIYPPLVAALNDLASAGSSDRGSAQRHPSLDNLILTRVRAQGKRVMGIERPFEPLVATNNLVPTEIWQQSLDRYLDRIDCAACRIEDQALFRLHTEAIVAGRWDDVHHLGKSLAFSEPAAWMQPRRDERMAERIAGVISKARSPVLFVVGAMHLVGPDSIVERLAHRGFLIDIDCAALPSGKDGGTGDQQDLRSPARTIATEEGALAKAPARPQVDDPSARADAAEGVVPMVDSVSVADFLYCLRPREGTRRDYLAIVSRKQAIRTELGPNWRHAIGGSKRIFADMLVPFELVDAEDLRRGARPYGDIEGELAPDVREHVVRLMEGPSEQQPDWRDLSPQEINARIGRWRERNAGVEARRYSSLIDAVLAEARTRSRLLGMLERQSERWITISRASAQAWYEQYRHSLGLDVCTDVGPPAGIDEHYVQAVAAADWPAVRALEDRLVGAGLYRESRDAEVARLTDRIVGAMQWFPGPLFFAVDALQAIGEPLLTEALESRGVVVEAGCRATPAAPSR